MQCVFMLSQQVIDSNKGIYEQDNTGCDEFG